MTEYGWTARLVHRDRNFGRPADKRLEGNHARGFRSARDPAITATGSIGRGAVWLPDPGARSYRDAPLAVSRRDDRMVGRG